MSNGLLDELARALVRPMPRRQAVRLLGATIVAAAVPGMRPRLALARRGDTKCDYGCGQDVRGCPHVVQLAPTVICCGSPARRYTCVGGLYEPNPCRDICDGPNDVPCKGVKGEDGCSEFHCCKEPHVCKNGRCSETCKHRQSKFLDEEETEYDRETQCCSDVYGVQPKDGNWSYRACKDTLRPRPKYKPTANGCGTANKKFSNVWPSKKSKYTGKRAQWKKVCDRHDVCYGTCRADKDRCDKEFCNDLDEACEAVFKKGSQRLRGCKEEAALYCAAVKLAYQADKAFENAQKEACFCC
jgi:secretory phospholipase A2